MPTVQFDRLPIETVAFDDPLVCRRSVGAAWLSRGLTRHPAASGADWRQAPAASAAKASR